MATLQKIGFQQTGYSEPFITDTSITGILAANASLVFDGTLDDAQNTIADAMRIENTIHKNQVTWGTLIVEATATNTDITFGNSNPQMFRVGDVIEYDHTTDRTNVRLYEVTAVDVKANKTTVTVSPAINVTIPQYTQLRTTGRTLDLGDGTLGATVKAVDEKVTVPVSSTGTWSADS